MFFVVGSSVRVLKAAAFKRFSVRPCWSPILLKLQNSIAGVFQIKLQNTFYNFGAKNGRCKYWSSIVLLESGITSEETKIQIFKFLLKVSVRYHFRGVMFKERFWTSKSNKKYSFCRKRKKIIFFWETKRCSAKMLVGKVVPRKINEEFTFGCILNF